MSCGCGCGGSGLPSRVNSDGKFQVSYDGGTTWVYAPELDPRTNATLPPPVTGASADEKRCKAANNVVRQLKDLQVGWSNNLGTGLTIVQLALALAAAAATIIFSGGTLAPILIPALIGLASAIVGTGKEAYDALFTSDVWDFVLCQLYCEAEPDGTFTSTGYNNVLANLDSHFSGNLALSFSSALAAWQVTGLNSAARIPSTDSLDCSACVDCIGCAADGWLSGRFDGATWRDQSEYIVEIGADYMIIDAFNRGDHWVVDVTSISDTLCCGVVHEVLSGQWFGDVVWRVCGTGRESNGAPITINDTEAQAQTYRAWLSNTAFRMKVTFIEVL